MKKEIKNIFLSSIHQNAGKTTVSLGLHAILKEKKLKTAFIKPVGQEVVHVGDLNIDKDTYLIGKVFHGGRKFKEMSPITVARGFTEKYIFDPHKQKLQEKIEEAFEDLTKNKDAIIVEGTGHAGVGSVIDFSNADVAHLLGSKAIIISEGGIGKSIDEIILNKSLFDLKKVEVIGVIINKVRPEKYDKIKRALKQGLKNKGVKLLGVIPLEPLMSAPTVEQIKNRLDLKVLCGAKGLPRRIIHTIVAAMEPHNMVNYLKSGTLVITSGDRIDNILLAVSSQVIRDEKGFRISGIILTGGLLPNPKILSLLKNSQIPILISDLDTYTIAARIENMICKIQKSDKDKIEEAARLVKKYVDVKTILKKC